MLYKLSPVYIMMQVFKFSPDSLTASMGRNECHIYLVVRWIIEERGELEEQDLNLKLGKKYIYI